MNTRPQTKSDQPMRTDDAPEVNALPSYQPASVQAAELLRWLQAPDGRAGWIEPKELAAAYREMAGERNWAALSWTAIGRELRRALRQDKLYVWQSGRHRRMYNIPRPLAVASTSRSPKADSAA